MSSWNQGKGILAFSWAILVRYSTLNTIIEATELIQFRQINERSWLPQMWLIWKKRPDMEIRLDKLLKWHFKWACPLDDPTPDLGNAIEVVMQGAPYEPDLVYLRLIRLDCPTVQCAATCKDSEDITPNKPVSSPSNVSPSEVALKALLPGYRSVC